MMATTNLDDLPDAVLLKIVNKLSANTSDQQKLRGLSTKWYKLMDENYMIHLPLGNSNYNDLSNPKITPAAGTQGIQSKGYNVHLVDMSREPNLSPTYASLIKTATLSGLIVPFNLRLLMESCHNITKLILNGTDPSKSTRHGSDPTLTLPQLKELYVLIDSLTRDRLQLMDPKKGLELLHFLGNCFNFPELQTLDISQKVSCVPWSRIPTKFKPMEVTRDRDHHDLEEDDDELEDDDDELDGQGNPGLLIRSHDPAPRENLKYLSHLLTVMPKLKGLRLRNINPPLYLTFLREINLDMSTHFKELEDIQFDQFDANKYSQRELPQRVSPTLPQFLSQFQLTKVKTLQIPIQLKHYPQMVRFITQNLMTLESLDLLLDINYYRFISDRELRRAIHANQNTFLLDLSIFASSKILRTLIINRTKGCPTKDQIVNVDQVPSTLRVFETNFTFTPSDLKFVTKNLPDLESFKAKEYSFKLIDEGSHCKMIKDLVLNHPKLGLWAIGRRLELGGVDFEDGYSNLVPELQYPTNFPQV